MHDLELFVYSDSQERLEHKDHVYKPLRFTWLCGQINDFDPPQVTHLGTPLQWSEGGKSDPNLASSVGVNISVGSAPKIVPISHNVKNSIFFVLLICHTGFL